MKAVAWRSCRSYLRSLLALFFLTHLPPRFFFSRSVLSDERQSNSFPFKVMDTEILPELSARGVQRTAKSLFRGSVVHLPALHAPAAATAQRRRCSCTRARPLDPFTPLEFMDAQQPSRASTFAPPALPSKRDTIVVWSSVTPCRIARTGARLSRAAARRRTGRLYRVGQGEKRASVDVERNKRGSNLPRIVTDRGSPGE